MDGLDALQTLGFAWPTPAYIIGAIVFGLIGFAAYRYGKKTQRRPALWLGVALMVYPYAVSQTWALYGVGAALCAGLWFYRR